MQSFIRVIEVWTPSASGQSLELHAGSYDGLNDFEELSKGKTLAYGEGLPGSAWKAAIPIVLKSFANTVFQRIEAAHEVNLTSGIAIPIFKSTTLVAVLVFLCGDKTKPTGAIEVWQDDGLSGQAWVDGYYGDLEIFARLSTCLKFPRGIGLPGLAWKEATPIIADLTNSNAFLRSYAAMQVGLSMGIGIPFNTNNNVDNVGFIVTFLSSESTPIAQRFEIWKPTEGQYLVFEAGIEQNSKEVESHDNNKRIKIGEGAIGQAWQRGIPIIDACPKEAASSSSNQVASILLAIPIFVHSTINSIVAFHI